VRICIGSAWRRERAPIVGRCSGARDDRIVVSDDDRAFFIPLGARIAAQRKVDDITHVELAEQFGICLWIGSSSAST
jgi:hypothetical protein